jgi:glycosyltransferase involved in cell wall biosynthesis
LKKLSILNLCFNSGSRLINTLDSIAKQTFKDFELIIIDDGSTDGSATIVEDWINSSNIDVTFIRNGENIGIPASLNKGLRIAQGEYISVMGDDIWDTDFLEQLHDRISNASENVGIIYCKARCFNKISDTYQQDLDPIETMKATGCPFAEKLFKQQEGNLYFLSKTISYECLFWANFFVSFTFVARKKAFAMCDGYDEKFLIEDYPMWFRLTNHFDALYLDEAHATYIRYTTNFSTTRNLTMNLNVIRLKIEHFRNIKHLQTKKHVQYELYTMSNDLTNRTNNVNKFTDRLKVVLITARLLTLRDFKFKRAILKRMTSFLISNS